MRSVLVWAFFAGTVGCGGGGVPPASDPDFGSVDLGPRDASSRSDGGHVDADVGQMDASGVDTSVDLGAFDAGDASGSDAFAFDAFATDTPDLGPQPDTSACVLADGAYDLCACGALGQDCTTTACPSGQTCAVDICGSHCVRGSAACGGMSDCPAGDVCTGGFCVHSGTGCVDSRDCALGFACEGGSCVDRRIPCSIDRNCPFGYLCDASLGRGTCVRLSRPCVTDAACNGTVPGVSQVCIDIDGDGPAECQFAGGPCTTNLQCLPAGVCTPHALTDLSVCGRYGPCRVVRDCASGMDCRDLWGDGVKECVLIGGCTNSAACPAHQVCATAAAGGPPQCLTSG